MEVNPWAPDSASPEQNQDNDEKSGNRKKKLRDGRDAIRRAISDWLRPEETPPQRSTEAPHVPLGAFIGQPTAEGQSSTWQNADAEKGQTPYPETEFRIPHMSFDMPETVYPDSYTAAEADHSDAGNTSEQAGRVDDTEYAESSWTPGPMPESASSEAMHSSMPGRESNDSPTSARDDPFLNMIRRAGFDEAFVRDIETPTAEEQTAGGSVAPEEGLPAAAHDISGPPPEAPGGGPGAGTSEAGPVPMYAHGLPPAPFERPAVASPEYVNRNIARRNALLAFAAGLLIGSRVGRRRIKQELKETSTKLQKLEHNQHEQMQQNEQQAKEAYNRRYWERRLAYERPAVPPVAETPFSSPDAFRQRQPGAEQSPPAQQPEEAARQGENSEQPQPERHVERDAWHSIVVDKHNHEDVSARARYGKEFTREQREVQDQQAPAQPFVGASVGPSNDDTPQPAAAAAPRQAELGDGLTRPELASGTPNRMDPQHLLTAVGKHGPSLLLNPWVWLVVGVLLLIFFGASLIG